jgi:hypothetical protein
MRPTTTTLRAKQRPRHVKEYLRRNLLHCKAVGAHANATAALARLYDQKRAPQWLMVYLAGIIERLDPVKDEMAKHRNEWWQKAMASRHLYAAQRGPRMY